MSLSALDDLRRLRRRQRAYQESGRYRGLSSENTAADLHVEQRPVYPHDGVVAQYRTVNAYIGPK
jgi:hypothetical protein